jgi:quercetin dioxygenase-like cupin family protein
MKINAACFTAMCVLSLPLVAQSPAVPTMDHEPHHHLALHNDYVKVFNVEVAPGDSIILHSHDQDTVAIAIGEQQVTVGIPGKTIPPSKNADGQVRLQRSGYIHSTHVDGDTPYHTVAVELMQPQTGFHNVCAEILPGQPLNCPLIDPKLPAVSGSQALLESNEIRASLVRVLPHKSIKVGVSGPEVIVALDAATISGSSKDPAKTLKPGDFVWLDGGSGQVRVYKNASAKDARFIEIAFQPAK